MKILVTGDNGFIGRKVFTYLYNNGYNVYGCGRNTLPGRSKILLIDKDSYLCNEYDSLRYVLDLKNRPAVIKMLADYDPDLIIHCAANATPQMADNSPYEMYQDNVTSTFTLCKEAKPECRFIFLSSIVVYGDVDPKTPTEWIDVCHASKPTSLYGLTKSLSEDIIWFLRDKDKTKILRMGAIVGQGLTHGILKDFISKLKTDSEYLEVLGDSPGSSKPFLHITDLLRVLHLIINNKTNNEYIYNICNKDSINVEQIANSVMDVIGIRKPIKWLGSSANWRGDNKILRANITDLGCGWTPSLSSTDAIRLTVKENI